jgi:single-strand DNA-binding protein
MSDINIITIVGRLVRDPEVRTAPSGAVISSFCLALNHQYQDKNKQWQEECAFVPCAAFARAAEQVAQRHKGDTLLAVGRLRTDSWRHNGAAQNRLVLVAEKIQSIQFGSRTSGIAPASELVLESEVVQNPVPF